MSDIKAHALVRIGKDAQGSYHATLTVYGLENKQAAIVVAQAISVFLEDACGANMNPIGEC